jgi:hypothetical protein
MTGKWQQRLEEDALPQEMVEILGCQKVYAYRAPCLLTEEHGLQGKNVSSQLLDQYAVIGGDVLHGMVTW